MEEAGCKAELKKSFPIFTHNYPDRSIIMIYFLADLLEQGLEYNKDEIQEVKWISIDEIKNMNKTEFRCYPLVENLIESLEKQNLYNLELFKDLEKI